MPEPKNRYVALIEAIFQAGFRPGMTEVAFSREDIAVHARKLKVKLPKNLGDLIYTFRYRVELPESIRRVAPGGTSWIIRPAGRARYVFVATTRDRITPSTHLAVVKVPDAHRA